MFMGLEEAIIFAKRAHDGQLRKYTGAPYLMHPMAVAGLVAAVSDDEDMLVAAVLHDVVEDTLVELNLVEGIFGPRVAEMVSDLTDISVPEDGNRAARKQLDRAHTAGASPEAKTIKLADLIDNTQSITAFDPNFAKIYMKEKRALLEVLTEGHPFLYGIAMELVIKHEASNK